MAPGDVGAWAHALGQVLGDETGRRSLADAGRRRSEEFTWQKMVDATRAVYREAMGADR